MGAMDVGWSDIGGWTALLAATGAGGTGAVVQPGERTEVTPADLIVRRVKGVISVVRPMEAGSMTAVNPVAVLRGADPRAVEALLERCVRMEEAT
jgi:hypothetical protein